MYALRYSYYKTQHQSTYRLCLSPSSPIIKVMGPALHDSVVQAVQKQGGIRDQRTGGMHLLVSHTTCHIAIQHLSLYLSLFLSLCYLLLLHPAIPSSKQM